MISYISPYAIDRNYGKALNEQIQHIQTEWICVTDQDFCFVLPDQKAQIHAIAIKGEYELYGCLTNRLAGKHQQYREELFDEPDINKHVEAARECQLNNFGVCVPTQEPIAGMMMLFRKETWERVMFEHNCLIFDKKFGRNLSKAVMIGVYGFHLYRWGIERPDLHKLHLIPEIKYGG